MAALLRNPALVHHHDPVGMADRAEPVGNHHGGARLGDLVGLLAAGVVVGPHALNWVDSSSETVRLLSDLGAVYLLFTMGLEIDLEEFNRVKRRSFIYGLLILLIGVCLLYTSPSPRD